MSLNKCVAVGRLTRDLELRYTPSNTAVASGTIAVERNRKNQNGEKETDFFNIVIWGKSAENMSNWIKKGYLVSISGRLQTRNYENQQGQRVYVTEIIVEEFDNLQPRNHQQGQSQSQSDFGNSNFGNQGDTLGGMPMDIDENGLPF